MTHADNTTASPPAVPMTNKQYLDANGLFCPFCRSWDIEAPNGVEIESGVGIHGMTCNVCEREWTDIYRLVRYQATPLK